jgi:hypothetical protein
LDGSLADPLYFVDVNIPVSDETFFAPLNQMFTIQDGVIARIEIVIGGAINTYNLSQILDVYGQPMEVWLSTYSRSREGSLPFTTVLFYQEKGIVIAYYDEADEQDAQIKGCPQQYPAYVLVVWSAEEDISFEEAVNNSQELGSFEELNYLSLEESTGLSVETFYETFKDPDNMTCLKTPANLWPSP